MPKGRLFPDLSIGASLPGVKTPSSVYAFLALGVVVIAQSGNIIRLADAHPVAIAAWRLGLASLLFIPIAGSKLKELVRLTAKEKLLLVLSGLSLALHFYTWIAAVQATTVANAAIFFSVNPVFVATASYLVFGERPGWRLFISVLLGLGGVVVIGFDDLDLSPGQLAGDAWAVLCAVCFTAYFLLGKRLRGVLSTSTYVACVYGIASLTSFLFMPFLKLPFFAYGSRTWLAFLLLALGPTMIGHTSFNNALKYLKAGWLSVLTLTEPVFAAAVAYLAWEERVSGRAALGYLLICLSVLVLVPQKFYNHFTPNRPPAAGGGVTWGQDKLSERRTP